MEQLTQPNQDNTQPTQSTPPQPDPIITPIEPPRSKTPLIIGALVTLFLLALGLAGYFYLNPRTTELASTSDSPTSTTSADPTADWETYQDPLGFSFKYPPTFVLNPESFKAISSNTVSVRIKDLSNYVEEPLGLGLQTALDDQESLDNNSFGFSYGSIKDSQKIVQLTTDIKAKVFTILQQIEVCDVHFTRQAIFYYNNHQVIVTVSAPRSLINELSDYSTTDQQNCGDNIIWKQDSNFMQDLLNNQAPQSALTWYQSLDQILSTFQFTN